MIWSKKKFVFGTKNKGTKLGLSPDTMIMWIMYYVDYALMSLLRPLNLFITWLFCPDRLAGPLLKNGSLPKIDYFDVSDDFEQKKISLVQE